MWCLTTLYATKLVFPVKPVFRHITTPEFSSDLLWTLLEWFSPLTWWRKQLQNLCTFHILNRMPEHEANMFTTVSLFTGHIFNIQKPETSRPKTWLMNGKLIHILILSSMIHQSHLFFELIPWNSTMFSHLPQTSTTPLLDHHTPWKLS